MDKHLNDTLQTLDSLLKKGILSESEYNESKAKLLEKTGNSLTSANIPSNGNDENVVEKAKTVKTNNTISGLFVAVIVILLIACFMLFDANQQNRDEVKSLNVQVHKLEKYKDAAEEYFDMAVFVIEGDDKYYHRARCSTLPSEYTYWTYNVEAAKVRGYEQCPICFKQLTDTYIESNYR